MSAARLARRQFLKLSALAAVSAGLAACGATPTATPVPPTATKPAAPTAVPPTAVPPTAAPAVATATKPAAAAVTNTPAPAAPTATTAAAAKPAMAYKEAPMLAELVKAGKLPTLDKRLPATPRLTKPVEKVGKYGGTWHRAYKGISDRWGPTKLHEEFMLQWDWQDDGIKIAANLCDKWEQNSNATEFTFYLRKGIKWSDGEEFNTDDVKFWYDDVAMNKTITPTFPTVMADPDLTPGKVSIVDAYTFKWIFGKPKPLLPTFIAKTGGGGPPGGPSFAYPEHYMKKFLPKNASQAEMDALLQKYGVKTWDALWGTGGDQEGPAAFWFKNADRPVISAWKTKVSPLTNQERTIMDRNPYFWKVDTEGNQLPYIDEITHDLFSDQQVFNMWVIGGKIDMQYRHTDAGSYTLYKENEKKGDYRVILWRIASTNCYHLNINAPDAALGKLFDTPAFRQALSVAINRKEINDLVFNGLYKPRQASPINGSPNYDAEFEKKWAEYDVAAAKKLLDDLGCKLGADGKTRTRPDGKPIELVIESMAATGSVWLDECGLVAKYWSAIGIPTTIKPIERSLYETRARGGDVVVGHTDWGFNRNSIVMADPGHYLGTIADNPWAPLYGNWYVKAQYKQVEPPADHPIKKIWTLWEQCQVEPDETKRNALFKQIIDTHKANPWNIGTVGENPTIWVAKNNFRNVPAGRINDDTLRDEGLGMPWQYYFET